MHMYLAGGAVRDLLLGHTISDRDYLVTGVTHAEFVRRFPNAQQVGRAFPVFLIDKLEFSFPRGETLEDEVKSRDLTVNALLLDNKGALVCHPNALKDLHNRVLRPTSMQSFIDDPLRVFRAARFWAKLPDFTPHESLVKTMRVVSKEGYLDTLSADRIGQETIKALNAPAPGNYLRLLAKADCLTPWFSDFERGKGMPAGPPQYHENDVIEHTARIMDKLAGDPTSVWMGLCHDIGKNLTYTEKLPKHHGHDNRGVGPAETQAMRIRLSNAYAMAGTKAARWHMVAAQYDTLRPGTRVDLLMSLHIAGVVNQLFDLVVADHDRHFHDQANNDLKTILAVNLPLKDRNLGPKSGERLRAMRAEKLASKAK